MAQAGRGRGNSSLFGRSQLKKAAATSKKSTPLGVMKSHPGVTGTQAMKISSLQNRMQDEGAIFRKNQAKKATFESELNKAVGTDRAVAFKVAGGKTVYGKITGRQNGFVTAKLAGGGSASFNEADVCRDELGRFASC